MKSSIQEQLTALARVRERQDGILAEAEARALKLPPRVDVPRAALEAIDAACLVPAKPLQPNAVRG